MLDGPAGRRSSLDDPTPKLINDLDLRVIDPNGSVYYPYVLNPAAPNEPATAGDNTLDNVEQVVISSPNVPGDYTVQVSYKGTLTNNEQHYSLILSGQLVIEQPLADFSGDGIVDFTDLDILTDYWLLDEPSVDIAPASGDGIVNFLDYARFAEYWD